MKKLISLVLSGAIVLIPIMNMAPVLACVSPETSVCETVNNGTTENTSDTTGSTSNPDATNPTLTTVVDSSGQTVTAGTLPDSPFYWFTNLIEKLQLALAFDPGKKADIIERHALRKLAVAQELIKKGKPAEAEQALENYTSKISAAQDFLNQVKDPTSAKAQILIEALSKTQTANISVLTGLLDKLPPQAAQKVALNVVRCMEKAVEKQTPKPAQVSDKPKPDQDKDKDKDKDIDKDKDKDQDQDKIKKEINTAIKNLRHDLEQKGTDGNMPKLENVANSVYSSQPQLDHSINEDQSKVTPLNSVTNQNAERQRVKEKERTNQR